MDAELTVELAAGDPTLAIPWSSDDGRLRYHDLKLRPDLLLYVDEASRYQELAEFLVQVNLPASLLQSAKCDAWYSTELSEPEAIYGAAGKFVSYVDMFFAEGASRFSFEQHEEFAGRLIKLLGRAPQISAAAEFIVRRCLTSHPFKPILLQIRICRSRISFVRGTSESLTQRSRLATSG